MICSYKEFTPDVDAATFIAPNATVAGNVKLGRDVSVWFGAVIRSEHHAITIGEGTNVQDNVTIHHNLHHPIEIGKRVTIGHNAVVHGCTVEDDALIGMNSTVLDDAVIGAESIVAAGALVLGGTVVPPRSLVAGVPAKVKKTLTQEEVDAVKNLNAPMYIEEAHDYAAVLGASN